ncbi:SafA/ExsA family spore coat assembly protein [Salicibibacter halophilus]|uniref:SafA/ExsA family spore coat assembly protein n=1 Tax=Salicibibacter halophilus TaxID=2502791 RepID=A0A514LMP2_9BACI|nr:SafA/ExsA family spore coat assembly protein [Salicibibacter halophilus]QDI92815.1 SafA/ExsA family spore coat assembly protein [Salicibibacter halophilus]
MKIHIVQKGDTLWNLAQKYDVDFEKVKGANTQLANPEMIMPGMKIKIPGKTVPAKKESEKKEAKVDPQVKEEQKEKPKPEPAPKKPETPKAPKAPPKAPVYQKPEAPKKEKPAPEKPDTKQKPAVKPPPKQMPVMQVPKKQPKPEPKDKEKMEKPPKFQKPAPQKPDKPKEKKPSVPPMTGKKEMPKQPPTEKMEMPPKFQKPAAHEEKKEPAPKEQEMMYKKQPMKKPKLKKQPCKTCGQPTGMHTQFTQHPPMPYQHGGQQVPPHLMQYCFVPVYQQGHPEAPYSPYQGYQEGYQQQPEFQEGYDQYYHAYGYGNGNGGYRQNNPEEQEYGVFSSAIPPYQHPMPAAPSIAMPLYDQGMYGYYPVVPYYEPTFDERMYYPYDPRQMEKRPQSEDEYE